MATVQLQKDIGSWLEFQIMDSSDEPVVLVERTQIRVFYKKHGALQFTRLTPLVAVADTSNPDTGSGENFAEVGFGVYAVYFPASILDTLETFTWVVTPDDPDALDFKQWTQQIDIVHDSDYGDQLDTIQTTTTDTNSDVNTGFDDVTVDIAAVQAAVDSLSNVVDAVQDTVEAIEAGQSSGINVSFVE
jgi:hypothetical protein